MAVYDSEGRAFVKLKGQGMGSRGDGKLEDWRPAGFLITVLVLHCPRCGRLSCCAVEGAALSLGPRRVLLRADGVSDWPVLRCHLCESADLDLVEDLR
jgi:hypothetical protein